MWANPPTGGQEGTPAPPEDLADEPGIWPHGWQFYASSAIITQDKERVVFPSLDDATKARVRSQAGPEAGAFLRASPVCEHTKVDNDHFNIFLRRRARLSTCPSSTDVSHGVLSGRTQSECTGSCQNRRRNPWSSSTKIMYSTFLGPCYTWLHNY